MHFIALSKSPKYSVVCTSCRSMIWMTVGVGKKHMFIFGANIAAAPISCLGSLSLIWNKNIC